MILGILGVILLFICVGTVGAIGETWTQATANAGWSTRYKHAAAVFDNKMWVLGGYRDGYTINDIWNSTDGTTWNQVTASAGWRPRQGHAVVLFKNKMWVLGGGNNLGDSLFNDIWYSTDGITWTEVPSSSQWSPRQSHSAVVFDNKMWVMGGLDRYGQVLNDVWFSTDGSLWTVATGNAGWSTRFEQAAVVFDHRMWVLGGGHKNDTWYSYDGITWTCANASSGWPARNGHSVEVFDNKMWVMGGVDAGNSKLNDVWYSTDGIIWKKATGSAGWSTRYDHAAVVFKDKMWVMGGYSGGYKNDVHYSQQSYVRNTLSIQPQPSVVINGTTTDYRIVLNTAPKGISGITYTVIFNNSVVGKIVGFTPPPWTMIDQKVRIDYIEMRGVDLLGESGTYNITLGTFRVRNEKPGNTNIVFGAMVEDRDGGMDSVIAPMSYFTVITDRKPFPRFQPLGGYYGLSNDRDVNGRFEDLDGNGGLGFNDIVLMFTYLDDIAAGTYGQTSYYDFDGNGAIGYNDVVTLYNLRIS